MSTVHHIRARVIPAALALLPASMDTPQARAMMMAIGLQESRFEHRKQVRGPAHGFWQFESGGGVHGVLTHKVTKPLIEPVLGTLRYLPSDCYYAIRDNDVLAAAFARLLLWSHPEPLPARTDHAGAWHYYLETWRPGRPHPETWDDLHRRAWEVEDEMWRPQ
jgi:hypothetical protein